MRKLADELEADESPVKKFPALQTAMMIHSGIRQTWLISTLELSEKQQDDIRAVIEKTGEVVRERRFFSRI